LAGLNYEVLGLGHGWVRYSTSVALMVCHHAISRCCQRWQVRTLSDYERVIETIGAVALTHVAKLAANGGDWHLTPECGIRIPFPNSKSALVLSAGSSSIPRTTGLRSCGVAPNRSRSRSRSPKWPRSTPAIRSRILPVKEDLVRRVRAALDGRSYAALR
jgi:hypothetical protein